MARARACPWAALGKRGPKGVVYLMYHELEAPGHRLCQGEPGYVRYVLRKEEFETQMALLDEHGFRGLNVSEDRGVDRIGGGAADEAYPLAIDDLPAVARFVQPRRAVAVGGAALDEQRPLVVTRTTPAYSPRRL